MAAILLAMLSVAAKDAFGVFSTIAMARGRAVISGGLDVGYEAAFIFTAAFGAGPVIKNGLTPHSLAVIVAILATAFFTATVSTRLGNKMMSENDRPLLTSSRASLHRSPFVRRRHLICLLRALPSDCESTMSVVKRSDMSKHDSGNNQEPFGYILVGTGTAGRVLAARLSQDPCCRVLLVKTRPGRVHT